MQVSVETTTGLERRMIIDIEANSIDDKVSQRLKETAKNIRIPGFRPGKVPLSVVKRRFEKDVRAEVTQEVIRTSLYDAMEEEQLKPAGLPQIEPINDLTKEGEPFQFSAVFEVYPEIKLEDFSQISIKTPSTEVLDEDIEQMIQTLRTQKAEWVEVERGAKTGDRVTIDYIGRIDGEIFEGGSADDSEIELGAGRLLPDFEQGIVGMLAQDTKDVSVTFPEDYGSEALQGKEAIFSITLKKITEPVLPELNEQFFSHFGVNNTDYDSFRSEVLKNMQRELDNAIKNKIKNQAMDGLIDIHKTELPKSLVQAEAVELRKQMAQSVLGDQVNDEMLERLPLDNFQEKAERRVKLGLIVGEVIKQKDLKPEEDRVRSLVENLSESYEEKEAVINWYLNDKQQRSQIEAVALEDQVVDYILGQAKVEEEAVTYQEFIKEAGRNT